MVSLSVYVSGCEIALYEKDVVVNFHVNLMKREALTFIVFISVSAPEV